MAQIGTTKGYASSAKSSYKKAAMTAKDAKKKKGYDKREASSVAKKYEAKGDRSMHSAKRSCDRKLNRSMKRTTK